MCVSGFHTELFAGGGGGGEGGVNATSTMSCVHNVHHSLQKINGYFNLARVISVAAE